MMQQFVKSPLNYTGGKYKLLHQMVPFFPKKGNVAIDLFCGGANVGINLINFNTIKCFDYNDRLIKLLNLIKSEKNLISKIEKIISDYSLSDSYKFGLDFYKIIGNEGLSRINKKAYLRLREDYNRMKASHKKTLFLFVLIIFGFNYQLRFNKRGEFNIPVGKVDFNKNIRKNLIKFSNRTRRIDITFETKNFRDLKKNYLKDIDFVYCDPPYLITNASYNENNGWTEKDEKDLLEFLDRLNNLKIKFALSNILYSDKKENKILLDWLKKYNVHKLEYTYKNSNYQKEWGGEQEVLITNY